MKQVTEGSRHSCHRRMLQQEGNRHGKVLKSQVKFQILIITILDRNIFKNKALLFDSFYLKKLLNELLIKDQIV